MNVGLLGMPRPLGLGPLVKEREYGLHKITRERREFVNECNKVVDAEDMLTEEQLEDFDSQDIKRFERETCETMADLLHL